MSKNLQEDPYQEGGSAKQQKDAEEDTAPGVRDDLMTLTKARLSLLVIVTTAVGYILGCKTVAEHSFSWLTFLHCIFGSSMAAFGAGVFNQLMEIDEDAKMERTATRPLPGGRMPTAAAFVLGAVLAAWGVVHLAATINVESAILAALTLITYIFIYTPMKKVSIWNTVVGAIAGAFPPLIGWAASYGREMDGFRWEILVRPEAVFLFALLFLWQMPHFLSINWLYREQYLKGGFVMLAGEDDSGKKTALTSLFFSACLLLLMLQPPFAGFASLVFLALGLLLSGALFFLSLKFLKSPERSTARKLFFATLIYLPLALLLLLFFCHQLNTVS